MDDLRGRTAVVTGAASGIGRALSRRLTARGMNVVVADVDGETLARTADELGARAVVCDVADSDAVAQLAEAAYGAFGEVHVLCNNAGVASVGGGALWETAARDWTWTLGVNLLGIVNGIRAFVPRMIDAGTDGWVVNTSSLSGLVSFPFTGPYGASKHAAVALSEQLAHELRARDAAVGVTVVCPAWVRTGILDSERHRPAQLRDGDMPSAPEWLVDDMNATGLDPDDVAGMIVDAIRSGTFMVMPNPGWNDAVTARGLALSRCDLPAPPGVA